MNTTPNTEQEDAVIIRATAKALLGREVRLTTRRGRQLEGTLFEAGWASLVLGYAGRFAYGGVVDIEALDGATHG